MLSMPKFKTKSVPLTSLFFYGIGQFFRMYHKVLMRFPASNFWSIFVWLASLDYILLKSSQICDRLGLKLSAMLLEAYAADKTWSNKGPASTVKPLPLCAGRLICDLYEDQVPKTVANFAALIAGDKGLGKASKKPLRWERSRGATALMPLHIRSLCSLSVHACTCASTCACSIRAWGLVTMNT